MVRDQTRHNPSGPRYVNEYPYHNITILSAFLLPFLPLIPLPFRLLLSHPNMLSLKSPTLFFFLSSLFQHLNWAISLTSTGQTLVLNDFSYYVPATPFATVPFPNSLQSAASAGGLAPVTVVVLSASNASLSGLEQAIDGFGVDDVWNEGFLEGMCMFEVFYFRQNCGLS